MMGKLTTAKIWRISKICIHTAIGTRSIAICTKFKFDIQSLELFTQHFARLINNVNALLLHPIRAKFKCGIQSTRLFTQHFARLINKVNALLLHPEKLKYSLLKRISDKTQVVSFKILLTTYLQNKLRRYRIAFSTLILEKISPIKSAQFAFSGLSFEKSSINQPIHKDNLMLFLKSRNQNNSSN